jgi:hypothetical protein
LVTLSKEHRRWGNLLTTYSKMTWQKCPVEKHEHSPYYHADGACLRHSAGCFLVVAEALWLMSRLSDRSA